MARGLKGTYGVDTANHPNRGDFGPGGGIGGGDFPGGTPPQPPSGPIDRAGAWGNPNAIMSELPVARRDVSDGQLNAAYNALRTTTNMTGTEANQAIRDWSGPTAPQSEQPGRGVLAPTQTEKWFQSNQPTRLDETGYMAPVAKVVNNTQFVPS